MSVASGDRISAVQLADIELRLRMATPGPWTAPAYRYNDEGPASYNTVVAEHANICGLHDGGQTRERIDANAHFIANAPTDVEALIASLREAWGEAEAATRQAQDFRDWIVLVRPLFAAGYMVPSWDLEEIDEQIAAFDARREDK